MNFKDIIEYFKAVIHVDLKEKQTIFKSHFATLTLENIVMVSKDKDPIVLSIGNRNPLLSSHEVMIVDYNDLNQTPFVLGSFYKYGTMKVVKGLLQSIVRPQIIIKKPDFTITETNHELIDRAFLMSGARKVIWE